MPETDSTTAAPARRNFKRWALGGLVAAVLGAAGMLTAAAQAGGFGHHHGWHGAMNPEEAGRRIDKIVEWVLSDVDATADQKTRVAGIAKAALQDLRPMRDQHRAARAEAIALLSQASIDRAALERLRAGEMQLGEAVSKRLVQALADSAEVLTPEQRLRLAERLRARMERHGTRG